MQPGSMVSPPMAPISRTVLAGAYTATAPAAASSPSEVKSLWIGDLQYLDGDESYVNGCFDHTGEVAAVKIWAADVTDYLLQETFKAVYSSVKVLKFSLHKNTGRLQQGAHERIGPAANKQTVGTQQKRKQRGSRIWGLELISAEMITI
nr:polyadenylate-binding protein RBP45B isoform X3 [Ipomoea batatas]